MICEKSILFARWLKNVYCFNKGGLTLFIFDMQLKLQHSFVTFALEWSLLIVSWEWRLLFCADRFEEQEAPGTRSFFTEIIASISDIKFGKDGRYILGRDYMTLKVWMLMLCICIYNTLLQWLRWESFGDTMQSWLFSIHCFCSETHDRNGRYGYPFTFPKTWRLSGPYSLWALWINFFSRYFYYYDRMSIQLYLLKEYVGS